MSNKTAFLFMDECSYEKLDLMALTGILIPSNVYSRIIEHLHQIAWKHNKVEDNVMQVAIELHARDFLPNQSDEIKISCITSIVDVINTYELRIIRGAYLNRSEIASRMTGDPKLYSLTFLGILRTIEDFLEDTLIIPVMDGVPGHDRHSDRKPPSIDKSLIRAFADFCYNIHHYRCHETTTESMIIKNSHNLGEATFVDSSQSRLLQLVDIISHLLLQIDREDLESSDEISKYLNATLTCAHQINEKLVTNIRTKMSFG